MYQITALKSSIGPTIESDLTEMVVGSAYTVRDKDVDFYRRHPDVFSVGDHHTSVAGTDGALVMSLVDVGGSSSGTTLEV